MKTLILIFTALIISIPSFSQFGVKGGFSLTKSLSTGSLVFTGGNLGLTYDFSERLRGEVLFEGVFRQDKITYISSDKGFLEEDKVLFSVIPVTLGIDYRFLTGRIQPYAGLNTGVISLGTRTNKYSNSSQYLIVQPKIGINIDLTEKLILDFAIKNHIYFKGKNVGGVESNILGFNLGVNYLF